MKYGGRVIADRSKTVLDLSYLLVGFGVGVNAAQESDYLLVEPRPVVASVTGQKLKAIRSLSPEEYCPRGHMVHRGTWRRTAAIDAVDLLRLEPG
jgi:hypothetical protein